MYLQCLHRQIFSGFFDPIAIAMSMMIGPNTQPRTGIRMKIARPNMIPPSPIRHPEALALERVAFFIRWPQLGQFGYLAMRRSYAL